jgi:hypothetical protein
VVTFASAGQVVWRGVYTDAGGDVASANVDLASAVDDLDFAMVGAPVDQSALNSDIFSTNSYDGAYGGTFTLEFLDSDTITLKRKIGDSGRTVNVSWEVIQWEESAGGGSTRRVMVIA